jgi:thiamine pyrophosphate-dependent acetolactate synthase large subunit-like protein
MDGGGVAAVQATEAWCRTGAVTGISGAGMPASPLELIGPVRPLVQDGQGALQELPQADLLASVTKWRFVDLLHQAERPRIMGGRGVGRDGGEPALHGIACAGARMVAHGLGGGMLKPQEPLVFPDGLRVAEDEAQARLGAVALDRSMEMPTHGRRSRSPGTMTPSTTPLLEATASMCSRGSPP